MCYPLTSLPDQANKTAAALKEEFASQATISSVQGAQSPQYSSYPDGNDIRTRYLSRLGIVANPQTNKIIPSKLNLPTRNKTAMRQRPNSDETSRQAAEELRNDRSVSFHNSDRIIHARVQNAFEVRKDLRGSKEDMMYNVRRNAAEFAAEGYKMFRGTNGDRFHLDLIAEFA